MKTLFALTTTLAVCLWLLASSSAGADSELNQLRTSYEAAVDRAVQSLREAYGKELKNLVETHTRNADLDGALAARAELERLDKGAESESEIPNEADAGSGVATDAEVQRLRAAYENAMDRALRPLRETYERELARIVAARTRGSDLEGALAARAELERIAEDPDEEEAMEEDEEENDPGSSRRPPDEFFVDKTWVSPAGTAFTFLEDGVCIREGRAGRPLEGTWKRRGPLVVSYLGSGSQGARYFRFASETEAWYGTSTRDIEDPVRRK